MKLVSYLFLVNSSAFLLFLGSVCFSILTHTGGTAGFCLVGLLENNKIVNQFNGS